MADSVLLDILRSGTDQWNSWREKNPGSRIDLRSATLRRENLHGVNFSGSDLTGIQLDGANLTNANLQAANLSRAYLAFTNLTGCNADDADFTEATIGATVWGAVHLNRTIGLDSCLHLGPSIIDHVTLWRNPRLTQKFLRGCGVPDTLIEYLASLRIEPIQFYSCFISYSTKDQAFADRLHADLQNKGVRCWFAPEDLKIGDPFRQRIDDAIRLHEKLLIILSEHSVKSAWVREEIETALERERREHRHVLFPIRLDSAVMDTSEAWAASIRRQRHIGDFEGWKDHDTYNKAFERLLRDLKADSQA